MPKRELDDLDSLYSRIAGLCEKRSITCYKMCKDIGIQPSMISDLKMGRKSSLSISCIAKIAAYFGVESDELLGIKKEPSAPRSEELNEYEREYLEVARRLSPENQAKLLELAKLYLMDQEAKR